VDWRVLGETFVTRLVRRDVANLRRPYEPHVERQRAALRAVLAAGMLVVGFALFGEVVLDYLGVSVESLSIAGGLLLLLLVALEMLRGIDSAPGEGGDVALVPLATPLVAGPGAIATVIVFARQHPEPGGRTAIIAGILAALLVLATCRLLAKRLARVVPPALLHFLTRVFGLLVAAIAVQLVVEGVRPLVSGT
jgi:multiple antibiotic resistance protein